MAEETNPIEWIAPDEGVVDCYANFVYANWTTYDVRVRFGQVTVVPNAKTAEESKWIVNEKAAVTMTFHEAKHLRNLLHSIIKDYESKNGELKTPQMPAPTEIIDPTD
jgi:hypothetical protein